MPVSICWFVLINEQRAWSRYSELFEEFTIAHPSLKCDKGNEILYLCTEAECEYPAIFCEISDCEECESRHEGCNHFDLKTITKWLKERREGNKKFMERVFEIEDRLIQAIIESRKTMVDKYTLFGDLDLDTASLVQKLFFRGEASNLRGKHVEKLATQLMYKRKTGADDEAKLLEGYTAHTARIVG